MNYTDEAIKKLSGKLDKLSKKAELVKIAVLNQLTEFCRQNSEFAQAVAQSSGTVAECLEDVVKDCGNTLSDYTAYSKAVAFWFPGATVSFVIRLDLGDSGFSNQQPSDVAADSAPKKRIELSFDDLL